MTEAFWAGPCSGQRPDREEYELYREWCDEYGVDHLDDDVWDAWLRGIEPPIDGIPFVKPDEPTVVGGAATHYGMYDEGEVTGLDLWNEHRGHGYGTIDNLDPHGPEGSR